jgi:hypothetical protein
MRSHGNSCRRRHQKFRALRAPRRPRVSGAIRVSGRAASYPRRADDAVIANGHTVTIDTAAVALNLTVGQGASGVLQYAMPGRPDR